VKGFENVTVEIEIIPVADYGQKIMLMQTSGEQMDIMQTYTLDYGSEFRNGRIIDLADYMHILKDTVKELPEWEGAEDC
jgi:ABC-type glycerol-3-phosphate transport system substrate-binding protein